MGAWPNSVTGLTQDRSIISSIGNQSDVGMLDVGLRADASGAWPSANRALYVPFRIERPTTAYTMVTLNGTAENGTTYVGIYTSSFTSLVTANALQSGTTAPQVFDITDTGLVPGLYYMALMSTSGTATFWRSTANLLYLRGQGMAQEATGGSLPATATFAAPANSYLPLFLITTHPDVVF